MPTRLPVPVVAPAQDGESGQSRARSSSTGSKGGSGKPASGGDENRESASRAGGGLKWSAVATVLLVVAVLIMAGFIASLLREKNTWFTRKAEADEAQRILRSSNETVRGQATRLEKEKGDLESRMKGLEDDAKAVESLRGQVARLKEEKGGLESRVEALETDLGTGIRGLETLRDSLKRSADLLPQELEGSKEARKALTNAAARIGAEVDHLRQVTGGETTARGSGAGR